jgi:hypothetical protein
MAGQTPGARWRLVVNPDRASVAFTGIGGGSVETGGSSPAPAIGQLRWLNVA